MSLRVDQTGAMVEKEVMSFLRQHPESTPFLAFISKDTSRPKVEPTDGGKIGQAKMVRTWLLKFLVAH